MTKKPIQLKPPQCKLEGNFQQWVLVKTQYRIPSSHLETDLNFAVEICSVHDVKSSWAHIKYASISSFILLKRIRSSLNFLRRKIQLRTRPAANFDYNRLKASKVQGHGSIVRVIIYQANVGLPLYPQQDLGKENMIHDTWYILLPGLSSCYLVVTYHTYLPHFPVCLSMLQTRPNSNLAKIDKVILHVM